MDHEMESLHKASTWDMVTCPDNKNIIGCKWVFCTKCKADRTIDKYKAHLVTRGFMQVYRIDYINTYSLVAKLQSFQTIMALTMCFD